MIGKVFVILAAMITLSACLPAVDFRSPIVRGRVLDASSGQPLPVATVSLQRFPDVNTSTDSYGDFVLPPKTNRTWCVPLPDYCLIILRDVDVVVTAPGYRPAQVKVRPAERGKEEVQITASLHSE